MRKSSTVWIRQHDKQTDDYKIILNCVRKLMKNKSEKEARKGLERITRCKLTIISESAICKKFLGQIWSHAASR